MALTLDIAWEPMAPLSGVVDDAAERETWGRFSLAVANGVSRRVLTQLEDLEARTLGKAVYGPVVGIAEWFARSWPHVIRSRRIEPDVPDRRHLYVWRRTHSLRMAGDGLALPQVVFRPKDQETLTVAWYADETVPDFGRVRYVESGQADLPVAVVRVEIAGFVDSVLARLEARCPDAPRTKALACLWHAASDPSDSDHAAVALSGKLDLLWTAATDEQQDRLRMAAAHLNPVTRAMADRLSPLSLEDDLAWADERWRKTGDAPPSPATWGALWDRLKATGTPPGDHLPWERGWAAAERLRLALNAAADQVPPVEEVEQQVGLLDEPDARVGERESLVFWRAARRATRLGAGKANLFRRARDLYAPLWGPGVRTDHAALYSPHVAGSASAANAFAAEWLAPVAKVHRALRNRTVIDEDDLLELAVEVGAPAPCVRHQVENRRLARVVPIT